VSTRGECRGGRSISFWEFMTGIVIVTLQKLQERRRPPTIIIFR